MLAYVFTFLASTFPANAADQNLDSALVLADKPKWEVKGKAMRDFVQGRINLSNEDYDDAVDYYIRALAKQPGCGECLQGLGWSLMSDDREAQAARVGHFMTTLFPEREEGWNVVARSFSRLRNWQGIRDAVEHAMQLDQDELSYWWWRNEALLNQEEYIEAHKLLDAADKGDLSEEDAACLRIHLHITEAQIDEANGLWEKCSEGKNSALKRYTEGVIAIGEKDLELASRKLAMSGQSYDLTRLTKAIVHLDAGRHDPALNLVEKVLEAPKDWEPEEPGDEYIYYALDAHYYKAKTLAGLGRHADALKALRLYVMDDSWKGRIKNAEQSWTLLSTSGPTWHTEVLRNSAHLYLKLLLETGETEMAERTRKDIVDVHGESEELAAIMSAAPATASK